MLNFVVGEGHWYLDGDSNTVLNLGANVRKRRREIGPSQPQAKQISGFPERTSNGYAPLFIT